MQSSFQYVSKDSQDYKKKKENLRIDRDSSFYIDESTISLKNDDDYGSGACGIVSLFKTIKDVETAVKKISESGRILSPEEIADIEHEAELNKLYLGIGKVDKNDQANIYLLMKKLPPSLNKTIFVRDNKPKFANFKEFLKFYISILKEAQKLHVKHGIVHGDIKDANLCMDKNGKIFFCDFGLARKLKNNLNSKTDLTSGKWAKESWHLPPELAAKIPADPSQDVYSLGQLLKFSQDWLLYWKHFGSGFDGDILAEDRLESLYSQMIDVNPKKRPSLKEAIKFCVDKYNNLVAPSEKLSCDDIEEKSNVPMSVLTKATLNNAMDQYKNFKNNLLNIDIGHSRYSFFKLNVRWLFTSNITLNTAQQLKEASNDQIRYQIAEKYIRDNPNKAFAKELKKSINNIK